ncbi:Uncharacterized protein ACO02O_00806 [Dirofilaria immitis]
MSSDQQIARNSSKKNLLSGYFRGAAYQTYHDYQCLRDTPEKLLKPQKLQKQSLVIFDAAEIQNAEQSNVAVPSVPKPISNPKVKKKDLAKKRNNGTSSELSLKASKRKVCKYFAAENSCYFGEYCRFLHIQNEIKRNDSDSIPSHNDLKPARVVVRPNIVALSRDSTGKKEQLDIRNSEISYFGRRFRDAKFAYDGSSYFIEFEYKITDPDWIFEIKAVRLRLKIPEHYPCESIMVTLSESTLPVPLVTYFNKEVKKFLEEKFLEAEKCNVYIGLGKTFIRWLDRNILNFFVEGLRRTKMIIEAEKEGITLHQINFANLTNKEDNAGFEVCNEGTVNHDKNEITQDHNRDEVEAELSLKTGVVTAKSEKERHKKFSQEESNFEQQSKTEVIQAHVFWNDFNGNIATLSVIVMALSIRCAKCSALSFLTCSVKQLSTSHCQKCLNGSSIRISPQLVHRNSNVIAFLEPKGCIPLDCVLLSSKLSYTCLHCGKEASAENLIYGAINKSWCYGCHIKCEFEIRTIRFVGDFNSIAKEDSSVPRVKQKKKKVERSMMLVEGQPLPENGACKHYKKSYRWFRFPCCGKLYPCDLCHKDAEKEHEMKLANRMVCGFCSKEQPFHKAKPCVNCNENVIRIKSQFWEGGKGCRDQVMMSRNDRRKHANSSMKTVSNKHAAQLTSNNNKKKKFCYVRYWKWFDLNRHYTCIVTTVVFNKASNPSLADWKLDS